MIKLGPEEKRFQAALDEIFAEDRERLRRDIAEAEAAYAEFLAGVEQREREKQLSSEQEAK